MAISKISGAGISAIGTLDIANDAVTGDKIDTELKSLWL